MHVLQLITLFCIISVVYIPARAQEKDRITIPYWHLEAENSSHPVRAVLWDLPIPEGGLGRSFNGYGTYRARVVIPESLKTTQLAFFVSSIDDADETFFNGVLIGRTGLFPDKSMADFQSGVREPRLYVIPQHLVKYNEENEVAINVFNYAGSGGLNGRNDPVIAPYDALRAASMDQVQFNDSIRTFYLAIQLCIFALLINALTRFASRESFRYALRRIGRSFNIIRFFSSRRTAPQTNIPGEVIFRIIMSAVTTICFFIFIFSELTFKYHFIASERFWFKGPAVSLYTGFLSLIIIYHTEIFGLNLLSRKPLLKRITQAFVALLSHPALLALFLLYIIILPVPQSWSMFIVAGSGIMFSALTVMFLYTVYRFIKISLKTPDSLYSKLLRKEGLMRGIFVFGFLAGFIIFHTASPLINAQASLVVTLFSFLYMAMSLIFYIRYSISLPTEHDAIPVAENLKKNYNLTPAEANIAEQICNGKSREQICADNNITPATLKIHLKSIYSKTIETDPFERNTKSGKLQRLTIFLHNLGK